MILAQSAPAALWLLIGVLPIAGWVVWSDLASMRIPNMAVLALVAVYAVVGALTLPLQTWAWSWLHLPVVLVIGFALSLTGGVGAGDAKFAAAMAPFVALGDLSAIFLLLSALAILTFVLHRLARMVAPIRAATPDWVSWTRRDFPFGIALAPALVIYLALAAAFGAP